MQLLKDELTAAIEGWTSTPRSEIASDTPLLTSGLIDSVGLVHLLLWVEHQLGSSVDATAIDIASEWDTVDRVVAFVAERQASQ